MFRLNERLNRGVLLFDGAMGTVLQELGKTGLPELLNVTEPETVIGVHRRYLEAGCDIVTANTFGANGFKLDGCRHSVEDVVAAAVLNARSAICGFDESVHRLTGVKRGRQKAVALDIGPLGRVLEPFGDVEFETAVSEFSRMVKAGAAAGADIVLIETMSDPYELKAAVIAAKASCKLPIFATLSFEENGSTFMGLDAFGAVTLMNALRVDATGVNCSHNPRSLAAVVDVFLKYSAVPVIVRPNAGLPKTVGGNISYGVDRDEFAGLLDGLYRKGVSIFGGCCGTNPSYIERLRETFDGKVPLKRAPSEVTAVSSGCSTCVIDGTTVAGERINPSGRADLTHALCVGDYSFISDEAISQTEAGARLIDVNCCAQKADEGAALVQAVKEIQTFCRTPLMLDSANPTVLERAARIYNGKPVINSVNGSDESLKRVLPIAAKYGAAVIGLTMDENGIPPTAKGRLEIAKRIIREAERFGIARCDVIIDCLVQSSASEDGDAFVTLDALRLVKKEGVKTVLGISNVSYGLPDRPALNSAFLTLALAAGLDIAIVNPLCGSIQKTVASFKVLNGGDELAADYIKLHRMNLN